MKRDALYHILDRAFRKALEELQEKESSTSIVDLYLLPNPDAGEFTVFDDEDHILVKAPVSVWEEQFETLDSDMALQECESILKEIVHVVKEEGIFDRINIMKPFSVLMVDEEMEVISELLLIDDEQVIINDDFLKHIDEELDTFLKQLMSDI
ncbi:MAG: hypothetical protein PHS30_08705 [Bacteroidales bacterium]|nr:hypothetical protein [Bacteroidales bacterium]